MVARRSICVPHVRQHDQRTVGSLGGICFSAKDGSLPHCQLISLAVPKMMVAGTGSSSSPATTSPWPAPARVHPNIPLFRGAHAGSTKVLATKGSGKTPAVYAGVASAVAFMGPKRRRPPVFYFSSMMAADAEALATDSSLSAHPASVAACMARPPA